MGAPSGRATTTASFGRSGTRLISFSVCVATYALATPDITVAASANVQSPLARPLPAGTRVRIVFEETGGGTKPQLPRKPVWSDARVDQLRRQRQAVGGVLADVRQ